MHTYSSAPNAPAAQANMRADLPLPCVIQSTDSRLVYLVSESPSSSGTPCPRVHAGAPGQPLKSLPVDSDYDESGGIVRLSIAEDPYLKGLELGVGGEVRLLKVQYDHQRVSLMHCCRDDCIVITGPDDKAVVNHRLVPLDRQMLTVLEVIANAMHSQGVTAPGALYEALCVQDSLMDAMSLLAPAADRSEATVDVPKAYISGLYRLANERQAARRHQLNLSEDAVFMWRFHRLIRGMLAFTGINISRLRLPGGDPLVEV